MFLDNWIAASKPISIPVRKQTIIVVGTPNNKYKVLVESLSDEIIRGAVLNTPPFGKHYEKGDRIIVHRDNILAIENIQPFSP